MERNTRNYDQDLEETYSRSYNFGNHPRQEERGNSSFNGNMTNEPNTFEYFHDVSRDRDRDRTNETRAQERGARPRPEAINSNTGTNPGRATSGGPKVANWSVFSAEVEGPVASAKSHAVHVPKTPVAEMGANVQLSAGRAGVTAGPAFAQANLNANTGATLGTTQVEANLLGLGFSVGKKTAINTPFGSLGFKF